jgi:Na+/melibiose symporter-like transporter
MAANKDHLQPEIIHEDIHTDSHTHLEKISTIEDVKGHDFKIDTADLPKGYFRSATFVGSMFAIGVSFACGVAGFAFAAPILGFINADIGPDPNLTWVALTYTLTTGICLILVGRLSDLFGRRWFMIGGSFLGLLGSIVCATAKDINAMIAGETLIGLGASAQISFACKYHTCAICYSLSLTCPQSHN